MFSSVELIGFSSKDLERDKKNGFSIAGPIYDWDLKSCLDYAETSARLNMQLVISSRYVDNLYIQKCFNVATIDKDRHKIEKIKLNYELLKDILTDFISKNFKLNSNIFGVYLFEEPRPWSLNEMSYMNSCVDIIKEYWKNLNIQKKWHIFTYHPRHSNGDNFIRLYSFQKLTLTGYGMYFNMEPEPRTSLSLKIESFSAQPFLNQEKSVYLNAHVTDPKNEVDDKYIDNYIKHDIYTCALFPNIKYIILFSLFEREAIKRTYSTQYKSYVRHMTAINKEMLPIGVGIYKPLVKICSKGHQYIERRGNIIITKFDQYVGPIKISQFIVKINSNNANEEDMKPFEVRFNYELNPNLIAIIFFLFGILLQLINFLF